MKNDDSFFPVFEKIMTSSLIRIFLPILIFSYILKRSRKFLQSTYFILILLNFSIVSLYFILRENLFFTEMEKSELIKIILPQISYFLTFFTIVFCIFSVKAFSKFSKEKIFVLFFLPCSVTYLMILGRNSLILCVLLLSTIYLYIKTMKKIRLANHIQTFAYIAALSYYFWYAFGNKPQIAALQVSNAYVGLDKFNYYISGILLICNCGGSFFLILLLIPVINLLIRNEEEWNLVEKEKVCLVRKIIYLKEILYFGIYYLVSLVCTSGNCIVQRRALLLIEDFAPKFFFDGCIFVLVNFSLLVLLIIFAL